MRQYLLITKAFHRHLGGTYLAKPHAMPPSLPAENETTRCACELPRPACGEGAGGGEMSECAPTRRDSCKSPFKGDLEGLSPVLTLTVPSGIAIVETTLFNSNTTRTKLLVP